jgi:hypothetical protein
VYYSAFSYARQRPFLRAEDKGANRLASMFYETRGPTRAAAMVGPCKKIHHGWIDFPGGWAAISANLGRIPSGWSVLRPELSAAVLARRITPY